MKRLSTIIYSFLFVSGAFADDQLLRTYTSTNHLVPISTAGVDTTADFNRDGYPDITIGIGDSDTFGENAGEIRVLSGKDGSKILTVPGLKVNQRFGANFVVAGDINKDGFPDILVGASTYSISGSGKVADEAFLISGKDGSKLFSKALTYIKPKRDNVGTTVAVVGDVNRDGYVDYALGGEHSTGRGMPVSEVQIFSGKNNSLIKKLSGEGKFGSGIAYLGDRNKDGFPEIAIGSSSRFTVHSDAGVVEIYSSKNWKVTKSFSGSKNYENLGMAVVSLGDINNDGFIDFATVRHKTIETLFTIFSGKNYAKIVKETKENTVLYGEKTNRLPLVDLNGDHKFQQVIEVPHTFSDADQKTGFQIRDIKTHQNVFSDAIKFDVIGFLPDSNGDGKAELLCRGDVFNDVTKQYDSISVISGGTGAVLFSIPDSDTKDTSFGKRIVVDDFDNDGAADIVVADDINDDKFRDQGKIQIFSGRTGEKLKEFYGTSAQERLGIGLRVAGDANGDGINDLAVSTIAESDRHSTLVASQVLTSSKFISGSDGRTIYESNQKGRSGNLDNEIVPQLLPLGDLNHDGCGDFDGFAADTRTNGTQRGIISGCSFNFTARDRFLQTFDILDLIPDISGDGVPDLILPRSSFLSYSFSGVSFERLPSFSLPSLGEIVRDPLSQGDVNGDSTLDFFAIDNQGSNGKPRYVVYFSGKTFEQLWRAQVGDSKKLFFLESYPTYGRVSPSLLSKHVLDFNHDGKDDVLVNESAPASQNVTILSGIDGRVLKRINNKILGVKYNIVDILPLGDTNGDGKKEILLVGDNFEKRILAVVSVDL